MVEYQLTLTSFLRRVRDFRERRGIVSRYTGAFRTYTYGDFYTRVTRLAGYLKSIGVDRGDRVATFAWNHHRHLELYFAVPAIGAVLHTINIRLAPGDISYILGHAEDKALFVDDVLLPAIDHVLPDLKQLKHVVVMSDEPSEGAYNVYEREVAQAPPFAEYPALDEEETAALCYTSGTTGRPKGVAYSHRQLFLHNFAACLADGHAISERDTILHVVPMFHANAWGIPYAAAMCGARQVFPGVQPTPEAIARIIERERVTYVGMVPTVAQDLLGHLESNGGDVSSLRALVLGGSPPSAELVRRFEEDLGVPVFQGWGMTEMSPMGTFGRLRLEMDAWPAADRHAQKTKQGTLLPGLEWKLIDEQGEEISPDSDRSGELVVRGPWVASTYYRDASPDSFWYGWLRTGDIATIDEYGYLEIRDRKKDLIKSGGEWISSVDLEQALMTHPAVVQAAVVAIPDEKWGERPLAWIVARDAHDVSVEALRSFLESLVAKWWIPDRIEFVDALPRTGVGKTDKMALRKQAAALLGGDQEPSDGESVGRA